MADGAKIRFFIRMEARCPQAQRFERADGKQNCRGELIELNFERGNCGDVGRVTRRVKSDKRQVSVAEAAPCSGDGAAIGNVVGGSAEHVAQSVVDGAELGGFELNALPVIARKEDLG